MAFWRKRATVESRGEPAGPQPLIRLERISRIFGDGGEEPSVALRDVTITIERGEYASVSGPSGCGKSTFLSILALLDTPTAGRYFLNGKPTDRLTPGERARLRNVDIGIVFQSFNLIGDMTLYENVEYPLTLRGASPAERQSRVMTALERVGLAGRAKQRPGHLSGGHQQLVAIARAFAGQPAIILADEPTGNLDSTAGEAVMQMLDELNRGGATVCLATHNPQHIARTPRRIYLFDGAVATGPTE